MNYNKLISNLEELTKYTVTDIRKQYSEHALISLLKGNSDCQELWDALSNFTDNSERAGEFHKLLRSTDVNLQGGVDMAIWNLIHSSSVFWNAVQDKDIWDFM